MRKISFRILECYSNEIIERKQASEKKRLHLCHKGKMATLKRSHNETSMKNKFDALKELEKGVPQKEVPLRFGVQKSTLSTWRRSKKQSTINAYFRKEK